MSRAVPTVHLMRCTDPTCPTRGTALDVRLGGHYHDCQWGSDRCAELDCPTATAARRARASS